LVLHNLIIHTFMKFRTWLEAQSFMTLPNETRQGLYKALQACLDKVNSYKDPEDLEYDALTSEAIGLPGVHVFDVPYNDRETGQSKPIPVYLTNLPVSAAGQYSKKNHHITISYKYLYQKSDMNELFRTIAHELGHGVTYGMSIGKNYRQYLTQSRAIDQKVRNLGLPTTDELKQQVSQLNASRPPSSMHNNASIEAFEGISVELVTHLEDYYAALHPSQQEDMLNEIEFWLRGGGNTFNTPMPLQPFANYLKNFQKDRRVWNKIVNKLITLIAQLKQSSARQGWYHHPASNRDSWDHPYQYTRLNYPKTNDEEVPIL
jgi:hypothetical protein